MKWKFARLNGKSRPEYNSWASMIGRCCRVTHPEFDHYGKRGIVVCDRWKSFDLFFEDMNPRPPRTSLERKNVDGPYDKDNCIWATQKDQSNNRTSSVFLEARGERMTVSQWADRIGTSHKLIRKRIELGWSIDKAIFHPVRLITMH